VGPDDEGTEVPAEPPVVILLDTQAFLWIEQRRPRARTLLRIDRRLFISPAMLLELQVLHEAGRFRLASGALESIFQDERWVLDEPPAAAWFLEAANISWTRDPFDRLLAAHAQLRGWRLATADQHSLQHLGAAGSLEL
jgi:PIN domain nuclease of toxin-antitoxin system